MIAPDRVHLGQTLEVEWWFSHSSSDFTLVTASLVGREIARRRVSARTGISVTTESSPFFVHELDRQAPERGWPLANGRGEVVVPARSVPSVAGKLNEIAWAIVVEASFQAETILREEFPLLVLPVAR